MKLNYPLLHLSQGKLSMQIKIILPFLIQHKRHLYRVKCARPTGEGPDSEQNDFPFKISSQSQSVYALHKKAAAGLRENTSAPSQTHVEKLPSHNSPLLVRKLNNDRARAHIRSNM